jgi:hypothetical protein
MQISRTKGKKTSINDSSRVDDVNVSNTSGVNQDSFRGRDQTGRQLNMIINPRGEVLDKSTTESGFKEVYFYDPGEMRRTQYNMSPTYTEGRQTLGSNYIGNRSPVQIGVRQSVLQSVKQDLNIRDDTANILGKKPIPSLVLNVPVKRDNNEAYEKYERSPKVITLAGNEQQPEFTTKTFTQRRSPRETNRGFPGAGVVTSGGYGTGTINFAETGPVLIDQPMNFNQYTGNYANLNQQIPRSPKGNEINLPGRDKSPFDKNEIMIETKESVRNKMSPNRNSEGEIVIDFNRKTERYNNDTIEANENDGERQAQNSFDREGNEQKGNGVRKYMRQMTRAYVPHKKEGRLVTKEHKIITPANDQLFPDRKKVIQKMNKLSHILLSTKEGIPGARSSSADVENLNTFERNTLRPELDSSRKFAASRSPQATFWKATKAMMSSKGPNCEDRAITRVHRFDQGGVVDLTSNIKTSKVYEVKKFQKGGKKGPIKPKYNGKDRIKASKIIQGWWREILLRFNTSMSKIVKIQAVWRGFFFRDHLYEYLYMLTLLSIFNERIRNSTVLSVFGKFFNSLKTQYLPRVIAIRKGIAAFKLQRQARKFLAVMRNKKIKLPLLIEKLAFRSKVHTFGDIKKFGDDSSKTKERNIQFLEKLKKVLRVNIFHDTLFSIFKIPMQRLTEQVIRYVLKRNIYKSDNERLRHWFMIWFKKTIKLTGKDALKKPSTKLLINSITKPLFNELARAMKSQISKEMKQKIIRRLIGDMEKHKEIWLRIYLNLWKEKLPKLAAREFFESTRNRFLGKFNRNFTKRVLGESFRKWRDAWMKSKDLRPYIKGLEHLQRHARRKAFDKVMPIDCSDGIKSRIVTSLFSKVGIFKKIPLRFYNDKWRKICEKIRRLKISGLFINSLGTRIFKRTIRNIIFKRFLDWHRKVSMLKYKDLMVNTNSEHQKIFATSKMVSNIQKHGKKVALKAISPELTKYLRSTFFGSIAKRITSLMPHLEKTRKRIYWRKYREQIDKLRQKETRNKFFDFLLKNIDSKITKNYVRNYLFKWKRNLPKNVDIKYYRGAEQLQLALWRRNIQNPLDALDQKIDTEKAKNGMLRSLGIKAKYIQRHWRTYLMKWKKISDEIDNREKQNELAGKLLGTVAKNIRRRILSNRFSHMRKVPKINMKDVFDRYKDMTNVIFRTFRYVLKPTKKDMLEKIGKFVGPTKFRQALTHLANLAINGNNIKKRAGLEMWRLKAKDTAIHEFKLKLLRFSITGEVIKGRKLSLASSFNKWIKYVELRKAILGTHKNWKMVNLGMVVDKMKNRRQNELLTRLKRLMNLDTRGRILLAMQQRLNRPRNTTGRLFDRWRRVNDITKQNILIQNMNANLIEKACGTLFRRLMRDKFVKCFGRWKVATRKPNDYYEKKMEGLKKLNLYVKHKGCKQPFNLIEDFKNYTKIFNKLLPANLKWQQRNLKNSMIKAWKQWNKVVNHYQLMENYGMMVGKVSTSLVKRKEKNRLASCFYKWKNIKKKTVYLPNVVKSEKIIMNVMQGKWRRPVFDRLNENLQAKRMKSGIFCFLSSAKSFEKNKVKVYFKKWFKTSILQDDHIKDKTMRSFKRLILENYLMGPMEKYFRRWLKAMIQKPVDFKKLENAFNVISFGFRKQNCRNPFELIKEHRAVDFLRNAINSKVFPKINSFILRIQRKTLQKWLRNAKAQTVKNFFAKYLGKIYGTVKTNFMHRITKSKFDVFRFNKPKVPELRDVLAGEKIIFGVFCRKYLNDGFFTNLKDYSEKKFLRSLLFRNSKYHRKALEPFFRRWRSNANKLKEQDMERMACLSLISKIRNHNFTSNTNNLLRRKFHQWKIIAREFTKKLQRIIPEGDRLVLKGAKRINYPDMMFNLRLNRLRSRQSGSLGKLNKMINDTFLKRLGHSLQKWRNVIGVLRLDEMRRNTMGMFLKTFGKRVDRDGLRRAYFKWSGKIVPGPNRRAIIIGDVSLRRVFTRPLWKKLFERTKMMNLKIPYGMSFKDAYIRMNPNVAKSIILRNVAIRPYYRRWIEQVDAAKSEELKLSIFNKIFLPNARKNSRLVLRKGLDRWRDVIAKEDLLNLKKGFHSKLLIGIYDRNNRIALRRKMQKWKDVNRVYQRNLADISLGTARLRNNMIKHGLNALISKLKLLEKDDNIKDKIRRNIYAVMRNNDKGNLEFCFNKWKHQMIKLREKNLKYKLLKFLIHTQEKKNIDSSHGRLHEAILKWRIRCAPIDYFDKISKARMGIHHLHRGLNKLFNSALFEKIKRKATAEKVKESLFRFISDYEKAGLQGLLRNKLKLWRVRLGDTDILLNRFRNLVDNYIFNSDIAYNVLFRKPSEDLVEMMRARVAFKTAKAQTIQDYCRNLVVLFQKMNVVKRNMKLHQLFCNLSLKDAIKVRIYLARWMKNSNLLTANNKAMVIQRYIRNKRENEERRRVRFDKAGNLALNYIKHKVLGDLQNKSIKMRLRQLLFRLMDDLPDEVKLDFLKKHTGKWRLQNRKMKEIEAADRIKYYIKAYIVRKWRDFELKKKYKMNTIAIRLFKKYLDKKKIYFNQWVLDSRLNRLDTKSRIIQNYLRGRLERVRDKRARLNTFNLIKKFYIHKLINAMKLARKINSNRALILYETLKTIFIQRPFETLRTGAQWIGRIRIIHRIRPKIFNALKKHYVPHYLKKWKANTYDDMINKLIRVQNWFRSKMILWRMKTQARREYLFNKYFIKLTDDNELLMKIAFKSWNKKAKILTMNAQATLLQKAWRGNTSKKNAERILNQKRLHAMLRRNMVKNICGDIVKCGDFIRPLKRNLARLNSKIENRYSTNNLLTLANNNIRNLYIRGLGLKLQDKDNLVTLRKYFQRFRINGIFVNNCAKKVQKGIRALFNKNTDRKLARRKELMWRFYLNYERSDDGKKSIFLRRWLNRATANKTYWDAQTIQRFLRTNLIRIKVQRFQNFFVNGAKKLGKDRVFNAVRTINFRKALRKPAIRVFGERLVNKTKRDKIVFLFLRRFHSSDDKLARLYIRKYLIDWRGIANRLKIQEEQAAVKVTGAVKMYIARKQLKMLKEQREKVLRILLTLAGDMDLKAKLYLSLWRAKAKEDKYGIAASVLQSFMRKVKNKSLKLKRVRRINDYDEGLNIVDDTWNKAMLYKSVRRIQARRNKNLLEKVGNDIHNKKIDHLKTAIEKINDYAFWRYHNRTSAANVLQKMYKVYRERKGLWGVITKIRRLRFILSLMANRDKRILNKACKIWKRNAKVSAYHQDAVAIQTFLRQNLLEWRREKNRVAINNLQRMFRLYANKKIKQPFYTLTMLRKLTILSDASNFYLKKLGLRKIVEWDKLKMLNMLFKIPKSASLRLKKKWLDIWRKRAQAIKEKEAALKIQRRLRTHFVVKRKNDMKDRIDQIIFRLACKHDDIRRFNLNLWNRRVKAIVSHENARIIQKYVGENWKRILAKKNWKKLSELLYKKNYFVDGMDAMVRYRQFVRFEKLYNILDKNIKKDGYEILIKRMREIRCKQKLVLMFNNTDRAIEINTMQFYLRRWRNISDKYKRREEALQKTERIFSDTSKFIAAKTLKEAHKVKSLFDLVDTVKNKLAFKKIKTKSNNQDKIKRFGDCIVEGDNDLNDKNKNVLIDRIYRIYIYKILDKAVKNLQNFQQNDMKFYFGSILLDNLHNKRIEFSNWKSESKLRSRRNPNAKRLEFSSATIDAKKKLLDKDTLQYTVPHLVNFLNNKIKERLRFGLFKLKGDATAKKFITIFTSFLHKKTLPEAFENIYDRYIYNSQTPVLQEKLKRLLRLSFLQKSRKHLLPVAERCRLFYLVKVTLMHREMRRKRLMGEGFRKWRFMAFMKKIAKKKMEAMYKGMHMNYLKMAMEVFGEDDANPGLIREIETFSNTMGMFTNENPTAYEEFKKKFTKGVSKKYIFPNFEYVRDYEESHIDGGDGLQNTEYYYEEDVGEFASGRFRNEASSRSLFDIEREDKKANSRPTSFTGFKK